MSDTPSRPTTAADWIGTGALSDAPTSEDRLDFAPYAQTLVDIILDPKTRTPLTIGVFGSWGSGKTTLMSLVRERLEAIALAKEGEIARGELRQIFPIWFNAWLYDKEDALWRALIMKVLTGIRRERGADARARFEVDGVVEQLYHTTSPAGLGTLSITARDLLSGQGAGEAEFSLSLHQGLELVTRMAATQAESELDTMQALRAQVQRDIALLERQRIESVEQFQRQFQKLVESYVEPYGYLVIFIDDLDRCLPEKAVEVLEAVKLFLDVPGCIFVLGIDQDVIERGIQLRYRELRGRLTESNAPFLLSPDVLRGKPHEYREFLQNMLPPDQALIDGGRYLEKIIQIPFVLPPIRRDTMAMFIDSLATLPHEECKYVFARGLEANPRQAKRAINIFTLLYGLSQNRTDLRGRVLPVRLAKLVVLQQRHPDLYDRLREDPSQLIDWERALWREYEPDVYQEWLQNRGLTAPDDGGEEATDSDGLPLILRGYPADDLHALRELLLMHTLTSRLAEEADANFANLTPAAVETYVFLSYVTSGKEQATVATGAVEPVTQSELPPDDEGAQHPALRLGQGLDPSAVGILRKRTYEAMNSIMRRPEDIKLPPKAHQEAVTRLAEEGFEIYVRLISSRKDYRELEDLLKEERRLTFAGDPGGEFDLPWEITYSEPPPAGRSRAVTKMAQMSEVEDGGMAIDLEKFWGFRYVLERSLSRVDGRIPAEPRRFIVPDARPSVLLALTKSKDLPQGEQLLAQLHDWSDAGLIGDVRAVTTPDELLFAMADEALQTAHIVLFFTHVVSERGETSLVFADQAGQSVRLHLSDALYQIQRTSREQAQPNRLFVFYGGDALSAGGEWSAWLRALDGLGAAGVVMPLVVPRTDVSLFVLNRFLYQFLQGQTAGEALREARLALLTEMNNPAGLFFALYGPAELRLKKPGEESG